MSTASLARTMAAVEAALSAGPRPSSPPRVVKVGVDLGTAYTVLVVLDEHDAPLAVAYERADVVRDGVVVDFVGAVDVVRRLKADVEERLGVRLGAAHGAYPPGVALSEVRAVQHVIEAAEMDCSGLVDEPTAANAVLGLRDGAVVDVGGGSTGIAVVADGTGRAHRRRGHRRHPPVAGDRRRAGRLAGGGRGAQDRPGRAGDGCCRWSGR